MLNTYEQNPLTWRTSSYSTDNGDCVEVAWQRPAVLLRDSKAPEAGLLSVDNAEWHGLLSALR